MAMDWEEPGTLMRMAEIKLPETPPMYRAINRAKALYWGRPKVTGRNRAMAMAAERPGTQPKMMPTTTPTIIKSTLVTVKRLAKAVANKAAILIAPLSKCPQADRYTGTS